MFESAICKGKLVCVCVWAIFLSFLLQNKMDYKSKTKRPRAHVDVDVFLCLCAQTTSVRVVTYKQPHCSEEPVVFTFRESYITSLRSVDITHRDYVVP
jgi:hypothetical protein